MSPKAPVFRHANSWKFIHENRNLRKEKCPWKCGKFVEIGEIVLKLTINWKIAKYVLIWPQKPWNLPQNVEIFWQIFLVSIILWILKIIMANSWQSRFTSKMWIKEDLFSKGISGNFFCYEHMAFFMLIKNI